MSGDLPSVLAPRFALGDGELFRGVGLSLVAEPLLPVHSLRRSRVAHDETWLQQMLGVNGLGLPEQPRAQSGDAVLACMRIEPHAWLVTGRINGLQAGRGWLHTELTERYCAFSLRGERAADVLSAGANLHGVRPGMGCRMAFAETTTVVVQCFAEDRYRLLVDVGLGVFMADWLTDAAHNLVPVEAQGSRR